MSQKYQGLFIFGEWLDALNQVPPETAMTIINNIYRYEVDDTEPPPVEGAAALIQSIMLSYEKRNKLAAAYGRRGANARWGRRATGDTPARSKPSSPTESPSLATLSKEELLAYWSCTEEEPVSEEDAEWDARRFELLTRARQKRDAAAGIPAKQPQIAP